MRRLLQHAGTPVAVTALLLLAGVVLGGARPTDTLTAGQSPRLTFQAEGRMGRLAPLAGAQGRHPGTLAVLGELPPREKGRVSVLFIGNSQTMAIMDMRPEDRLSVTWLGATLNHGERDQPFAVRLASEANLTMSELLIKLAIATPDNVRRPDVVVVGIVLDGLRWVEARGDVVALVDSDVARGAIRRAMTGPPALSAATRAVEDLLALRAARSAGPSEVRLNGRSVGWPIADLEQRLDGWAESGLPLFGARRDLHARIKLFYTNVRNKIFAFRTATRRPIAPAMYATNLELIEASLRLLQEQRVRSIFYIAPIRPLEPNPYVAEDVERFRRDLSTLCRRYGALYLDYTRLVPEALWTNYPVEDASGIGGQPDFAHFTGAAHRLLGERLAADLRPWIEPLLAGER